MSVGGAGDLPVGLTLIVRKDWVCTVR